MFVATEANHFLANGPNGAFSSTRQPSCQPTANLQCRQTKILQQLENGMLGAGFKYVFSPLFGEDFRFDEYFSDGLKPPTRMLHPQSLTYPLKNGWFKDTPFLVGFGKAFFRGFCC